MKKFLIYTIGCLMMGLSTATAQKYQNLWITGSAVPGGVQKLVKGGDGSFKYAGKLSEGEVRVMTTKKAGKNTTYLLPLLADANIVNRGLSYQETTDASKAGWQVAFAEDHYRFTVNTKDMKLQGEVFYPWGELFIAGGATDAGWKCEGKMLLMKQDVNNPYVWTWEGELKSHPGIEEPESFKFQGQDRWSPKGIHPYKADADILTDGQFRTGGDDTKWKISKPGRYRIKIDLFNETVKAELIK